MGIIVTLRVMKYGALLILPLFAFVAAASRVSYEGYKVLKTQPLNEAHSEILRNLQNEDVFDFWQDPNVGRSADVLASPELLPMLEQFLHEHKIQFSVMIDNLEELRRSNEKESMKRNKMNLGYDWNDYYRHDEINNYIDELASTNSDFINTVSIGKTNEGRDMRVIQITKAGSGAPNVWVDAGIHAREWIAHAMATYMIDWLVNGDGNDILDKLNFHILPMANPDGYEYSHDTDRMWRKNRRHHSSGCYGVDLNRNFGFHWGESGTSNNECADIYLGPTAFSEPETQNMKAYVESLNPIPILGHSIHSYSQLWLWPYGYGYNEYPENYQEIKKLAEDAAEALYQVHGTRFDPINSADLYPAAGASDDWYKGTLGTRYAFTSEMRDTGRYGFELPPKQIIPSGEEFVAGMRAIFEKLIADSSK